MAAAQEQQHDADEIIQGLLDSMYLHEALRQPDRDNFVNAMDKEVRDQMENGNFSIIRRTSVPEGATILPSVWQLRRKRDILTRTIKKWKARLNIDGSKMKKHRDYELTYAPVASWNSIRLLLTMTLVHNWVTQQIDFVQAFPQAPIEREMYMSIPKGYHVEGKDSKDYVLQVHRNIYGQKQAGRVWNQHLVERLKRVGFVQSEHDECVFYCGSVMYVLYTDDSILAGPSQTEIDKVIAKMKSTGLELTIEGTLTDFLGVNLDRKQDGTIHLHQPHLIDQILTDLRLDADHVNTKPTPMSSSKLLRRHTEADPFDESFNYRSVIGKLGYLEKGSRPDIAFATHQCARFSSDPRKPHGDAIRWIGRYLRGTRTMGTILKPDKAKSLEVYVDADFAGNWTTENPLSDKDTARSRHGYIIMYAGCPIVWKSQLQTEIAMSSTESEYTGMSYALREAIPIMNLLKEMQQKGFDVSDWRPRVHCKVYEDNQGALEMAKVHKFRPRTKHMNVKLHHFRSYVDSGDITIHPIDTSQQPSDMLTKPVNVSLLMRFRKFILGW